MSRKTVVRICALFFLSAMTGVIAGCLLYDHYHPPRPRDYVVTVIPNESGLHVRT